MSYTNAKCDDADSITQLLNQYLAANQPGSSEHTLTLNIYLGGKRVSWGQNKRLIKDILKFLFSKVLFSKSLAKNAMIIGESMRSLGVDHAKLAFLSFFC